MSVVFGGEKAWRVRRLGDIGIAYHWVNGEPAMVLYPATRSIAGAGAFILALSRAHKYVKSNGNPDLAYMLPMACKAAVQMGFTYRDKSVVRTIVDAICDGMPDLVSMPPEPKDHIEEAAERRHIGEMSLAIDGEIVAEQDVLDVSDNELPGMVH